MAAEPFHTNVTQPFTAEQLSSAPDLPDAAARQPAARSRLPVTNGKPRRDEPALPVNPAQNPELLHWRANVLLDEMMLGAIDIAASDSVPARALASKVIEPQPGRSPQAYDTNDSDPRAMTGGRSLAVPSTAERADFAGGGQPSLHHGAASSASSARQGTDDAAVAKPATNRPGKADGPDGTAQVRHGTEQWLFAAEQRYQQLAARRQAAAAPEHEYDGWSMAADAATNEPYDQYSVMAPPYSREHQYDRLPNQSTPPSVPTAKAKPPAAAGTAAPTVRKRLRSNLLPRMNALDSRTAQQEMAMLQNSIETILPDNHESRVRARHLLEKAHGILMSDPGRSAEVEYYLQQVRMIVQRVQETAHWSQLYQRRLRAYLLAWLALSLIVVVSRYLYAGPLTAWLARLSGQSGDSLWIYNILTLITAFFFGALGGGSGALINLVRHARMRLGFFDRKYGLRGLILPIIGAVSGLVLCVIFGIGYALLGLDPSGSLWFSLLPALLAVALGASQEYLYGTR